MAKYQITHSCGHTVEHDICGPTRNRQGMADWLADRLCPDCYRAEITAERERRNASAAETNRGNGLPELTGTPKQVAWAESIRAAAYPTLAEMQQKITSDWSGPGGEEALGIVNHATGQSSARWWIDHHAAICKADSATIRATIVMWVRNEFKRIIEEKKNEIV